MVNHFGIKVSKSILDFFNEISLFLNKTLNKYENVMFDRDLNVNPLHSNKHHSILLSNLIDSFNLTDLIKEENCVKSQKGSLVDILLSLMRQYLQKIFA